MQIIIPIQGKSIFFNADEYYFPKPLIEIDGRLMIEHVIECVKYCYPDASYTFIIDSEDAERHSLDKTLEIITDNKCSIIIKLDTLVVRYARAC